MVKKLLKTLRWRRRRQEQKENRAWIEWLQDGLTEEELEEGVRRWRGLDET